MIDGLLQQSISDGREQSAAQRGLFETDGEFRDAIWKQRDREQDARNASVKSALAEFKAYGPSKIDVKRLPAKLKLAATAK